MLNPHLRTGGFQKLFSLLSRFTSLFAVGIESGYTIECALLRIVVEISSEQNRSGFGEFEKEHLMTGCVPGRIFQDDGPITEHIMIGTLHENGLGVLQFVVLGKSRHSRRRLGEHCRACLLYT